MKRVLLTFAALSISFGAFVQQETTKGDAFKKAQEFQGNTIVVLVGVSAYANLPESKQLDFADDDARLMEEYIDTWSRVKIHSFIDSTATKNNVGIAIHNVLQNEAKEGDRVILYFSGHGDVDTTYGDGYLLLSEVTEPSQQIYQFNDAFPLSYLEMMMEKAANRGVEVIFLSDACKSGAIENEKDANQRMLQIGSNTSSIVSCGPNELSTESIKYGGGHGVFTYYLVQGLMGLADSNEDGTINFKELSRYIEDNVAEARNYIQNPMSRGLPNKKITAVNDDLLAKAKQQENLSLAIASVHKHKSMYEEHTGVGYYPLLSVLHKLVVDGAFFEDEINEKGNSIKLKDETMKSCSSNPVYDVSINSKGDIIASVANKEIYFYNTSGTLLKKSKVHSSGVTAVQFHPTQNIVCSSSWKNDAILWDFDTETELAKLTGLGDEAYAISFITADQIAIGTNKGDLFIWNTGSNEMTKKKIAKKRLNDIKVSGNRLLIAAGDGKVYVYDLSSNSITKEFQAHRGGCSGIAIAPMTESIYTVGHNKTLEEWDLNTFSNKSSLDLDYAENREIAINLNENYLFVASRRYDLDVVDLNKKTVNKHFASSKSSGLVSVAFNDNNGLLTFGDSRGRVHIDKLAITTGNQYALKVRDRLLADEQNKDKQYEIDGTVLMGLNMQVNKVLVPLVNGEAVLPSLEEIKKVKRYAEKALELGQLFPEINNQLKINYNLVKIFEIIESKDFSKVNEALRLSQEISQLDPKGSYGFNIQGQLHTQLQDFSNAKNCAGKAESKAPLWAEASCGFGKIYVAEGDYVNAEAKFLETIEKGPQLSKGYYNLGKLYLTMGRIDEGKQQLQKSLEIDQVENIVLENAKYALMAGDDNYLGHLTRKYKDFTDIQLIDIKNDLITKSSTGRFEDAYNAYQTLLKEDSTNINTWIDYGYFLLDLERNNNGKKFVESTFVNTDSDNKRSSDAMLRKEIKRVFSTAKQMDGSNMLAEIGAWLSHTTEPAKASIDNFLNKHKNSNEALCAVAKYYIAIEKPKESLAYLKTAFKSNAGNVETIILFMEAQKQIGKEAKNAKALKKHLVANPNSNATKYRKSLTDYYLLGV